MPTKLFVIEDGHLSMIERIAKRLFTETRMDGDEMRNAAQALDGIRRAAIEFPDPEVPRVHWWGGGLEGECSVADFLAMHGTMLSDYEEHLLRELEVGEKLDLPDATPTVSLGPDVPRGMQVKRVS